LDQEDLALVRDLLRQNYQDGIGKLHCDTVYRVSSEQGDSFEGEAERVLDHASVPDVIFTTEGHHILVYNDVTPYKLFEVLRSDPERVWRQGLLGDGGMGMSIDRRDGLGFQEVVDLDLNLERVQWVVDPDLVRRPDDSWRMVWFGILLDQAHEDLSPLHSDLPHNMYRSVSSDWRSFPAASVAVASEDGDFGGVDPTVLDLEDGYEVLLMGPMPHTVLAWESADGQDWGETALAHYDTLVPGATPDAMRDPLGLYRLHFMRNGQMGHFQVTASSDGRNWSDSPKTLRQVEDGFNPTVNIDPDGVWWLYWNENDADCVQEWAEAKPPE
jgi:hypothetical protein